MHTFKKGDRVTVYNQMFSGKPIIEGKATILKPSDVEDYYWVKFDNSGLGDPGRKCQRFVFSGEAQTNPKRYLAKAQAEYDKTQKPVLRVEKFPDYSFTDESGQIWDVTNNGRWSLGD